MTATLPQPMPDAARIEDAAARLFALLPAHVRLRDAQEGGLALQALVGVLASASAEVDAGLDALYDALFVESAPESALADLAALVGAVPLTPLPPAAGTSARGYVANAIRYRRGKGTARVLEALARDVTGLGAVVVEYYQRLARTDDLTDIRRDRPAIATLTAGQTAALAGAGFDRLPRLADLRSIARSGGRHHVPHVGAHLSRLLAPVYPAPPGDGLAAADLARVPVMRPWAPGGVAATGHFQLAAQPGGVLRLMNPDRRAETAAPRTVAAHLADRLRRLPLHLETAELRAAFLEGRAPRLDNPPWFGAGGTPFTLFARRNGETSFLRVPPAHILIANLDDPPAARPAASIQHVWYTAANPPQRHDVPHPILLAFDPVTGRAVTAPPAGATPEIVEIRLAHATGAGDTIGAGAQDRNTADLPFDIIEGAAGESWFLRKVDAAAAETGTPTMKNRTVRTLVKALAEWQASGAGRRGLIVLTRCDLETAASLTVALHPGQELTLVAAQFRAPRVVAGLPGNPDRLGYLVRKESRFSIDAPVSVVAASAPASGQAAGRLVLDGLELTRGLHLAADAALSLSLRHCTLRAPGAAALSVGGPLAGVAISLDRCVSGALVLDHASGPGLAQLHLKGSVVAADGAAAALAARAADATICDCTLLGAAALRSLEATNVIFDGPLAVTRRQAGCLRYSWALPGSTTPRRFRCQPDLAEAETATRLGRPLTDDERLTLRLSLRPGFLDHDLAEPALALLHPRTRREIMAGGEGETEMGVFANRAHAIRNANLAAQFDDFLPFGLEAAILDDTLSQAASARRNQP